MILMIMIMIMIIMIIIMITGDGGSDEALAGVSMAAAAITNYYQQY